MLIKHIGLVLCGALTLCMCGLNPVPQNAGGGVETGNTTAIGRVIAPDNVTRTAMIVNVFRDAWKAGASSIYQATAPLDASGYYRFDSLAAGRYRVSGIDAEGKEGFSRTFAVALPLDSIFIGTDSLRKVGTIKGIVTKDDGTNLAGVTVSLRGTSFKQTLGSDGAFSFSRVPPGEQIIVAQTNRLYNGVPQLKTVVVIPGETTTVAFFLPAEHKFALNILPGQVWSYQYEYKTVPDSGIFLVDVSPIGGFLYYVYVKDTVMNDVKFFVVKQYSYEASSYKAVMIDTAHLYIGTHADTLLIYEGYASYAMPTLFKRTSPSTGISEQVKILYDTTVFRDFRIPVIFNATPNSPWYSRPLADMNFPLIQRYVGNEQITVPGGTFNCMRMEWEWADATPVKGVNYVSDFGNVKQTIEDTVHYNNGILDTSGIRYLSEYIGTDTTAYQRKFPRLPPSIHDSLLQKVLDHWNFERYRRWIRAVDTTQNVNSKFYLEQDNTYSLEILIKALRPNFKIPVWSYEILFDSLMALPETLTAANVPNLDMLVYRLISPEIRKDFAQGWDDCDWDYTTKGLSNEENTIEPYGHSAWPQALYDLVDGYYLYINNQFFK